MSNHRRKNLQAAEEAMRHGQLELAARLLSEDAQSSTEDRRLASDLSAKIADRIRSHIQNQFWIAAIDQLESLIRLVGETEQAVVFRSEILDRVTEVIRGQLDDHQWDAASTAWQSLSPRLLASNASPHPVMQWLKQAQVIRNADRLAAVGRFAEAEQLLIAEKEKGLPDSHEQRWAGLDRSIEQLQANHEKTRQWLLQLHAAAEKSHWDEVYQISGHILAVAAKHPLVLPLRERAHAELQAQGRTVGEVRQPKLMLTAIHQPNSDSRHSKPDAARIKIPSELNQHRILWIDGIGGYLMCDCVEAVLGQTNPNQPVDLMVVGDLSRRSAVFRRSGEEHLLQPLQSTLINGVPIERATSLRDRDMIQVGERVQLQYFRPNPLSATARLEMRSRHRWHQAVDGVLLLGDACILGPSTSSHILCPFWGAEVLLFRNRNEWMCRSSLPLEIDGKSVSGAFVLVPGKRIEGPDFSMTLD